MKVTINIEEDLLNFCRASEGVCADNDNTRSYLHRVRDAVAYGKVEDVIEVGDIVKVYGDVADEIYGIITKVLRDGCNYLVLFKDGHISAIGRSNLSKIGPNYKGLLDEIFQTIEC